MDSPAALPPGRHSYEDVLAAHRTGLYRWARLRAASGRLNLLIGLSETHLAAMRGAAAGRRLGLVLLGSRVSGPRSRQRGLHPALAAALPLSAARRTPSPTWPGADGVLIEKTAIKEFGLADPRTSDLTVVLVDPSRRPLAALESAAAELEAEFRRFGTSFPVKVFPGLEGRRFGSEEEFLEHGAGYLERHAPPGAAIPRAELRRAFRELYAPLALPKPVFTRADAANGLWNAVLSTVSFTVAFGFHPVIPAVAFAFGLGGRYLARFKSWVARSPAETPLTNAAALLADAAIGIGVMALVVSPAAGFGLSLERIAKASLLHTLSKGSWRLWLDKRYSRLDQTSQARGVFLTGGLNFAIGLVTAFVYAGRPAAVALQCALAAGGLALAFRPSRE